MRRLELLTLNIEECDIELQNFRNLLDSSAELSESKDILPFFRKHKQLSCLIALTLNLDAEGPELCYAYEYEFSGDFRLDLIVGDRERKAYCFIEFEDARDGSLFQTGRAIPEWGSRFLKGYSQLMDWFWKRTEEIASPDFQRQFGKPSQKINGLLIVGRSMQVGDEEKARLEWLRTKVIIDSQHIICYTFDELYEVLRSRLDTYHAYAAQIKTKTS